MDPPTDAARDNALTSRAISLHGLHVNDQCCKHKQEGPDLRGYGPQVSLHKQRCVKWTQVDPEEASLKILG